MSGSPPRPGLTSSSLTPSFLTVAATPRLRLLVFRGLELLAQHSSSRKSSSPKSHRRVSPPLRRVHPEPRAPLPFHPGSLHSAQPLPRSGSLRPSPFLKFPGPGLLSDNLIPQHGRSWGLSLPSAVSLKTQPHSIPSAPGGTHPEALPSPSQ